ncbi:MAG: zinc ribbon domain-containing protein [Thermoplasmata archaeon]
MAAARQELTEGEVDPAEADWFAQRLPEGTYHDPGEVMTAVNPAFQWNGAGGPTLVWKHPSFAVATGTRLIVQPNEMAEFTGPKGEVWDAFSPGEHVISRESSPHAASHSRPAAPGFSRTTIRARLVFGSAQPFEAKFACTIRTSSGRPLNVSGTVAGSVRSPGGLLEHARNSPDPTTSESVGEILSRELVPNLTRAVADREPQAVANDPAAVEDAVRSCAADIGLTTSRVTLDHVGSLPSADQMAQLRKRQQEQMANLPPEVQAMIQTRMAARAQIGTPSASPTGVAATVPRPSVPASSPSLAVICPACRTPNPSSAKFCNQCGGPLAGRANCPQCGQGITPGIAFCGNCGAKIG